MTVRPRGLVRCVRTWSDMSENTHTNSFTRDRSSSYSWALSRWRACLAAGRARRTEATADAGDPYLTIRSLKGRTESGRPPMSLRIASWRSARSRLCVLSSGLQLTAVYGMALVIPCTTFCARSCRAPTRFFDCELLPHQCCGRGGQVVTHRDVSDSDTRSWA